MKDIVHLSSECEWTEACSTVDQQQEQRTFSPPHLYPQSLTSGFHGPVFALGPGIGESKIAQKL